MRRILVAACALFTAATGAVAVFVVERDRTDTLRVVEERTSSMSRMIMAHGDAAADGAMQIINSVFPLVQSWDLEETNTGRTIAARFKEMADSSTLISSAWVVNAAGINIVDSWGYPAKPIDAAGRPYFQAHASGADDPVIVGDDRPGSVTGRERFTFSRAVRHADGTLKAVIVVGIYKSIFDTLYEEAVNWPSARAGLYTISGEALARIETQARPAPAFTKSVIEHARGQSSGTDFISAGSDARIVSWRRSRSHPQLFATSSQLLDSALEGWTTRSWLTALLALAANLVFWALAYYTYRMAKAQEEAKANEIAVREVNHRVKNSLQLMSSLIQIRARKSDDPAYKEAAREMTSQLMALAETYRFVQSAHILGTSDMAKTVEGLCGHLAETYGVSIEVDAALPVIVNASHSTALSVIVNELVTNAIKHGGSPVKVTLNEAKERVWISVSSSRGQLPGDFHIEETKGFGLRAVRTMLTSLGGRITARNLPGDGTVFQIEIPSPALHKA